MTTNFPTMVGKDDPYRAAPVPLPEHEAFQGLIAIIEAQPFGPREAYDLCVEGLFLVSGLLEGLAERDPATLEILSASELTPTDLEQLELWFDQQANEIAKTIS
jgi:hypothetical protein